MEGTMTAQETQKTEATDPVCGMIVDIATARASGLTIDHKSHAYYFCGRGCKLEFEDDPEKYLDPRHHGGYRVGPPPARGMKSQAACRP